MKRLAKVLHWLNVDTALGAVITSMFIAENINSQIPSVAIITLFIAVLSIYNFDHLLDARQLDGKANSPRRSYYQRNQKALAVYQLFLLVILLSIIWYLPLEILRAGIILGLITVIYFLLLFIVFPNRFILKEVMISVVFTTALFLAPVYSGSEISTIGFILILWLEILVLAIINTLLFAWYDYDNDKREGHVSLARELGTGVVYKVILSLIAFLTLLIALQVYLGGNLAYQSILLLMGLILLWSLLANKRLVHYELYRVSGESIFLLPILVLL